MEGSDTEDWQSSHFKSRHIDHSRAKGSGRGKGVSGKTGSIFDPRSSYGVYQISCPALAKVSTSPLVTSDLAGSSSAESPYSATSVDSPSHTWLASSPAGKRLKKGKGNSRRSSKGEQNIAGEAKFEIHGEVEGEGNEGGMMCTLDLGGVIHGIAVLAGSRRLLGRIIRDLDGEEDPTADLEAESIGSTIHDSEDEDHPPQENGIEEADERDRKRIAAFEKNSFRVPKFWMRWKGYVSADAPNTVTPAGETSDHQLHKTKDGRLVEINTAYLVFSGNDCAKFSGTFSCHALGWKNVKLNGLKVVSKPRDCPLEWSEVGADI